MIDGHMVPGPPLSQTLSLTNKYSFSTIILHYHNHQSLCFLFLKSTGSAIRLTAANQGGSSSGNLKNHGVEFYHSEPLIESPAPGMEHEAL